MLVDFKAGLLCAVAASAVFGAGSVAAQTVGGVEELVVTAQKRSESLQSVPLAIQAISGDNLVQRQITSIQGLTQSLPNVNFGQTLGNAQINIRGLGFQGVVLGNEGRVAYHQDNVYIARPTDQIGQYFDVERVEVLYGPQGNLYGRNATGGVINVITKAPTDEFSGYLDVTGGDYGLFQSMGAISGPLAEKAQGRLAFYTKNTDGFGENLITNEPSDNVNVRGFRGKLHFDISDQFEIDLAGDYLYERDHGGGYTLLGIQGAGPLYGSVYGGLGDPPGPYDNNFDKPTQYRLENFGAMIDAHLALERGIDIRSISAYREGEQFLAIDIDTTSTPLGISFQDIDSWQFSEELRLSQTLNNWDWQLGLFYFHENQVAVTHAPLSLSFLGQPAPLLPMAIGLYNSGTQDTDAVAGYANVRFHLTDRLTIEPGARYSFERKEHESGALTDFATFAPVPVEPLPAKPYPPGAILAQQSRNWHSLTPSLIVSYDLTDDILAFVRYAEGFKSGGYNVGYNQAPFNTEKVKSFEAGVKSSWFDKRLTANITGFYYDYTNLQVQLLTGFEFVIENAASAEVTGVELALSAQPTENLHLDLSAGFLNAEYADYVSTDPARLFLGPLDLSGNKLTNAPETTLNIGAEYVVPTTVGDVSLRVETRYVSKQYLSQYNLDTQSAPENWMTNVFLRYVTPDESWSLSVWAKNLEDSIVPEAVSVTAGGGIPITGSLTAPRTWGATVRYAF